MTRLNVDDARCEALFVSGLQQSDAPDAAALAELIRAAVRGYGVRGCAGRMAQEFGDHPEVAADRMRWIRQLVAEGPATRRLQLPSGGEQLRHRGSPDDTGPLPCAA
jgi:hypothetical protein